MNRIDVEPTLFSEYNLLLFLLVLFTTTIVKKENNLLAFPPFFPSLFLSHII